MTHSGKRTGADRKPGARALVMRPKAEGILATVNEEKIWQRLLRSRNARILLDAIKYLTERWQGGSVSRNAELSRLAERIAEARKRAAERDTQEGAAENSERVTAAERTVPTS